MTSYEKLLSYADNSDILFSSERCEFSSAMSLCVNNKCAIFLDESQFDTSAEKFVALAHELGHCETGSFYNIENPVDIIGRHEYRATKWAIKRLTPIERIIAAQKMGIIEIWELAEHFNVPEPFIRSALNYYRNQGLIE